MSIALFVPEFWSARLLRWLDPALVYAQPAVVNRNWEGEFRESGDTVNIQKVGTPTIVNYVKGTPMTPERPRGTTQALTIDRDKGFYIAMDDLDAVQVNVGLFDETTRRAAIEMAKVIDSDVAARQVAGAGVTVGSDGTPTRILTDWRSAYLFAVECRRKLDNNEAPEEGRWMAINPDLEAMFLSDSFFIPAGDDRQHSAELGRIAGFTLYKTTRTPSSPGSGGAPVPNWKVVFGAGNYATTFANQLVKTEAERLQGLFEDAVKGRNVWGARIVEPETLGVAHVARTA